MFEWISAVLYGIFCMGQKKSGVLLLICLQLCVVFFVALSLLFFGGFRFLVRGQTALPPKFDGVPFVRFWKFVSLLHCVAFVTIPRLWEGAVCGLEAGQCPLLRVFYVLQRFNRRTSNRCGFVAALKTGLRKRECDFYFLSGRVSSAESNVRLADVVSLRLPQVPERSGVRPQARHIKFVSCPYIYKNGKTVSNGNLFLKKSVILQRRNTMQKYILTLCDT